MPGDLRKLPKPNIMKMKKSVATTAKMMPGNIPKLPQFDDGYEFKAEVDENTSEPEASEEIFSGRPPESASGDMRPNSARALKPQGPQRTLKLPQLDLDDDDDSNSHGNRSRGEPESEENESKAGSVVKQRNATRERKAARQRNAPRKQHATKMSAPLYIEDEKESDLASNSVRMKLGRHAFSAGCRKIRGDGNCIFRSISMALFGTQMCHLLIRIMTFCNLLSLVNPFEEDLRDVAVVGQSVHCGILMEIAKEYHVNISLYARLSKTWHRFKAIEDRESDEKDILLIEDMTGTEMMESVSGRLNVTQNRHMHHVRLLEVVNVDIDMDYVLNVKDYAPNIKLEFMEAHLKKEVCRCLINCIKNKYDIIFHNYNQILKELSAENSTFIVPDKRPFSIENEDLEQLQLIMDSILHLNPDKCSSDIFYNLSILKEEADTFIWEMKYVKYGINKFIKILDNILPKEEVKLFSKFSDLHIFNFQNTLPVMKNYIRKNEKNS